MPTTVISGAEILRRQALNADARWPTDSAGRDRLHPIALARIDAPFTLPADASVMVLGDPFAMALATALGARNNPMPAEERLSVRGVGIPIEAKQTNLLTPSAMDAVLSRALSPAARGGTEEGFIDLGNARWLDPLAAPDQPTTLSTLRARRLRLDFVFSTAATVDWVIFIPQSAEAWWDARIGAYVNVPSEAALTHDPTRFSMHLLDAHDVRQALESARERIRMAHKGTVKFAVGVSPRPIAETFTGEDVLLANERTKSVLVAGARAFADGRSDIAYLPMLETVARSAPSLAFGPDGRTVGARMMGVLVERISAALTPSAKPLGYSQDPIKVPSRGQVLQKQADALVARFDDDTVVSALKNASRSHPDAYDVHMRLARKLGKDGRTAEAVEALRDAVAAAHSTADLIETQIELGRAQARIGHYADAERALRAASELRPADGSIRLDLGIALMRMDRLAEADAEIRRACDLMPEDAVAHLELGRLLRTRKRPEEAADALARAVALAPQLADAQHELGQALLAQRKHAPALAALRRAAELDPRFASHRSA